MASELCKSATVRDFRTIRDNADSPHSLRASTPKTFSSWIQLFLSKRRNVFSSHSLMRPSVSLCMFLHSCLFTFFYWQLID